MATDATGTPTTNYGFPKVNTSVDAPSGLVVNLLADAVDTALKTVDVIARAKPGLGIVIAMGG